MREAHNVDDVAMLPISMMGFIFYGCSPRFVADFAPETPSGIERVGVFVNEPISYIKEMVERNKLTYVQLHGGESGDFCRQVSALSVNVIKAISISEEADFKQTSEYQGVVDFLLFDTKCSGYGGSGESFDWSMLECYQGETPFLLSGGIDQTMAEEIKAISHPKFIGVDINSRFELSPAVKNVEQIRIFLNSII